MTGMAIPPRTEKRGSDRSESTDREVARGDLLLASRSPRRRRLLEDSGISVRVAERLLDDSDLRPGAVAPLAWVQALAFLKGRFAQIAEQNSSDAPPLRILAADTLCASDGQLLGQPCDRDHAAWMLRQLSDRTHETITGVCLLDAKHRLFFADVARVSVGPLTDSMVQEYLDSGDWRGKAGGYNLSERLEAGWPITVEGDPSTVIGLPMRRLLPLLTAGAHGA